MTKMATKMYNGHGAVGDLQEATAKTTPRREDGPCGHCGGAIYLDPDLGFTCRMCNRAAGPPTPEEIRRGILRELTSQAADIRALRKGAKDGPLSVEEGSRTLLIASLAAALVKNVCSWLAHNQRLGGR